METKNKFPSRKATALQPREVLDHTVNKRWREKCNYLCSVIGIQKSICVSCSHSRLYDKTGKVYMITREMTLDEVKKIVETIKTINDEKE